MARTSLKGRIIRPILNYSNLTVEEFLIRVTAIDEGMTDNSNYRNLPVDMNVWKADIKAYKSLLAPARDGSKTAKAALASKRQDLARTIRALGHYVETACKGDMAKFISSGFEAAKSSNAPKLLPEPAIRAIEQRISGQLLLKIKAAGRAKSYDVAYGVADSNSGIPDSWTVVKVAGVKQGVPIDNLTPGTIYIFRVRALGPLGNTEWSTLVSRMCI